MWVFAGRAGVLAMRQTSSWVGDGQERRAEFSLPPSEAAGRQYAKASNWPRRAGMATLK